MKDVDALLDEGSCLTECPESGEYQLDQLSDALPRYGAALLWAEQEFDSGDAVENLLEVDGDDTWDDWSIGASASLTVHEDVELKTITDLLEAEMYEQVRSSPGDFAREVLQRKKWALGQIGFGLAGTAGGLYFGLEQQEPGSFEVAGFSAPWIVNGWKMLHNEFGPRDVYEGVKHIATNRQLPPRAGHEELIQGALEDLYVIDIDYLERDLGDLDDLVQEYGLDELNERHGIDLDKETYNMVKKKLDSNLEDAKYLKLVWDPTEDKRYLEQIIGESFLEKEFAHPADLFASEYGHTPYGYP